MSKVGHKKRKLLRSASPRDLVCDRCWEHLFSVQDYKDLCLAKETFWRSQSYCTTISDIQKSAREGCSWCNFLCEISKFRKRCFSNKFQVELCRDNRKDEFILLGDHPPLQRFRLVVDETEVLLHATSPESHTARNLLLRSGKTLDKIETSFHLIKDAIDECKCERNGRHPTLEQLPSRLVDLQPEDSRYSAKLIPVETSDLSYITLSYCWGTQHRGETTMCNLTARMHGLDESELPKTIRDTFVTARHLGYRYVWVDAVCIVQDRHEDKLNELARMTTIYEHAALTVFAASAHHADEGIMRQFPALPGAPRMPYWDGKGNLISADFRIVAVTKNRLSEPGHRRAWTCQEQLLSERLLVFNSSGVEFRCAGGIKNIDELGYPTRWENSSEILLATSLTGHTCFNMKTWLKLISQYSIGEVSHDEDRLFALAGIAEKFQRHLKSPYVAGIFVNSFLPRQLLWKVRSLNNDDDDDDDGYCNFAREIHTYIAPSWSWASHKSCVGYDKKTTLHEFFKFSHHEIVLRHPNLPFGPVISATLHLRGRLRKADSFRGVEMHNVDSMYLINVDEDTTIYIDIDRKASAYRKTDWFLLPVLWVEDEDLFDTVGISGLVVSPKREAGVFYRVGTFSGGHIEFFENVDEQDIILI